MPPYIETVVVIILLRKNTNSKLSLREKINVDHPFSSCNLKGAVENFVNENYEGWTVLEYQSV